MIRRLVIWLLLAGGGAIVPAAVDSAAVPGSATVPPRLLSGSPPPPLPGEKSAEIDLGVWIRTDGTVDGAERLRGNEQWLEAARAAVMRWRFTPVRWGDAPIAARTEVSFSQGPTGGVTVAILPLPNLPGERHAPREFGLQPPALQTDLDLVLPLGARVANRGRELAVSYVVEEDGAAGSIQVLDATDEGTLRAALDQLAARRWTPGAIRGVPVAVEMTQSVSFLPVDAPIAALAGGLEVSDPVYPYERLLAEEEGAARIQLRLEAEGRVGEVVVLEATREDFGAALQAAAESWRFSAEAAAAQPTREYEHRFRIDDVPHSARRLAGLLRRGAAGADSGAGLDAKPAVVARPSLVYPRALFAANTPGSCEIECIIDRAGVAQLPRVRQCSAPAFGWAAATFVNGLRFKPLTRAGRVVEPRVVFPVQFNPVSPEAKRRAEAP